jgi:hypothetical protein
VLHRAIDRRSSLPAIWARAVILLRVARATPQMSVARAAVAASAASLAAAAFTMAYIPLDERPATMWNVRNLAQVTGWNVLAPSGDALPSYKQPANLTALDEWLAAAVPASDIVVASCVSACGAEARRWHHMTPSPPPRSLGSLEGVLYGGLITSRCSNDTTATVLARAASIVALAQSHPAKWYVSSVVMRIPSYNEDIEEPWYWALYGADLFTFRLGAAEGQWSRDGESVPAPLAPPPLPPLPWQLLSGGLQRDGQ